ncbi:hypothetical protein WI41_01380 [Burkholderia latens]|uniref:Uncharacterized protein n=1 Tax=Burkholderia latens TaxID=488446 RepID=A0AAP1G7S2_9BURK|nr:hypothetical protein WI41_01380 [Burkholderia latens]
MCGRAAPIGFVRFYRTAYGLAGASAVRPVVSADGSRALRIGHPANTQQRRTAGNIDAQAACPQSLRCLLVAAID